MKRIILILILVLLAQPAFSGDNLLKAGVSGGVGLIYNGRLDAGFSGPAVVLQYQRAFDFWNLSAGLESGFMPLGVDVLLPLGGGISWKVSPAIVVFLNASVLPGLALFRPSPLWLVGFEVGGGCTCWFNSGWGLEAGLAWRALWCPEYSARVAPYSEQGAVVTLSSVWAL